MNRFCFAIVLILIFFGPQNRSQGQVMPDTTGRGQVKRYLEQRGTPNLNLPNLVKSIYAEHGYAYFWAPGRERQLRDALMTLECVIPYGLTPELYHLKDLTWQKVNQIISEGPAKAQMNAETDILMTDAILTFMYHLHFGRFNPKVSLQAMDAGRTGFRVDSVFQKALASAEHFREVALSVQPQTAAYKLLQDYQRLLSAQYTGDCYQISSDTLRLIAVNLERYRWENKSYSSYLEVNIPTFTLHFIDRSARKPFKIIVGKAVSPTPMLESQVNYFTTAPDWTVPNSIFRNEILPKAIADPTYLSKNNFTIYNSRGEAVKTNRKSLRAIQEHPRHYVARQSSGCDNALGQIVFNFDNPFSVYLHDTPNRHLFNQKNRALSHGCIRVEKPERLVELLLTADAAPAATKARVRSAMKSYTTYRHRLQRPMPIVIRYVTCEVVNGLLVRHDDIYNRDKALADQLFKARAPIPAGSR